MDDPSHHPIRLFPSLSGEIAVRAVRGRHVPRHPPPWGRGASACLNLITAAATCFFFLKKKLNLRLVITVPRRPALVWFSTVVVSPPVHTSAACPGKQRLRRCPVGDQPATASRGGVRWTRVRTYLAASKTPPHLPCSKDAMPFFLQRVLKQRHACISCDSTMILKGV